MRDNALEMEFFFCLAFERLKKVGTLMRIEIDVNFQKISLSILRALLTCLDNIISF